MSASDIITIIVSLGGFVTVLGGVVVQIIMAMRRESKAALAVIDAKADVIAEHVNSAASASVAKITQLHAEVAQLREMLADSKTTAAVLAQAHTAGQQEKEP